MGVQSWTQPTNVTNTCAGPLLSSFVLIVSTFASVSQDTPAISQLLVPRVTTTLIFLVNLRPSRSYPFHSFFFFLFVLTCPWKPIYSFILFLAVRFIQDIEYSSLCYRVGPCSFFPYMKSLHLPKLPIHPSSSHLPLGNHKSGLCVLLHYF